jgi:hypothetical protein
LLSGGGDGRVVAILIAIGAGKNDDAEFHGVILASPSNGRIARDEAQSPIYQITHLPNFIRLMTSGI